MIMNVDALKLKVIKEFETYCKFLYKGYQKNYDFILNEISFIQNYDNIDNPEIVCQYFLSKNYKY